MYQREHKRSRSRRITRLTAILDTLILSSETVIEEARQARLADPILTAAVNRLEQDISQADQLLHGSQYR